MHQCSDILTHCTWKATLVPSKVELVYHKAKKLSKSGGVGVGPFIFSSNEARTHLLADIITLNRQLEAVLI